MAWWPVMVAGLAAIAVRIGTGSHPIDDAYITLRYARNLASGLGLVYNPGELVLGTTTPLWAAVLAACARVGLDIPDAAWRLAALCDGGTAALIALLALRLGMGRTGAALIGLVWAVNPMSVAYASGGMETSLFVLLCVGSLALVAGASGLGERAAFAATALAGLAAMVRPEGWLLLAAVLAWLGWRLRRAALVPAMVGLALAGGWVVAAWAIYGSPLPQTTLAKQVAYLPSEPWSSGAIMLVQAGLPGWSTFFPSLLPIWASLALAAVGLGALKVLGWAGVRQGWTWQPFALFGALYFGFHLVVGVRGGRLFPWYLVPLAALYLIAAAGGLAAVGKRWRGQWATIGAVVLVGWQLLAVDWTRPFLPAGFELRREAVYEQVGRELASELPANALLAAPEIGTLGYFSGLRVLDTVGLVSPEASRYYPLPREQVLGDNAIPARLILDAKPDVVATLDQFAVRSLLVDAEFQRDYRLVRSYPAPIWLSTELLVFRRIAP